MCRRIASVLLFVAASLLSTSATALTIDLKEPTDGAEVPERPIVAGKVSDPKATVWVVVHPMEVSDYWVQPAVSVRGSGEWKVQIYVGRPGNLDVGKRFELRAVANPKNQILEGEVVSKWPDAEAISELVEITRGK